MPDKVIGLDSASQGNFTRADLDGYKARGVSYIELYEKWATPALCALIHAEGLGIAPIWESSAERALDGYAAGVADAKAFLAAVPTRFGVPALPSSVAAACTVDFDATAAQQVAVLDYIRGWKDGLAGALRSKVYGNGAICHAAKAAGYADIEWVAGGAGMRGTKAELQAGTEDEYQEVGDKEGIGSRWGIDSDVMVSTDLSSIWWPDGDPRQLPPAGAGAAPAAPAALRKQAPATPADFTVAAIQQRLADLGWDIDVDGREGAQTRRTIMAALASLSA